MTSSLTIECMERKRVSRSLGRCLGRWLTTEDDPRKEAKADADTWAYTELEIDWSASNIETSPIDRDDLKDKIFGWVCRNRGRDAEDVARTFGLSGSLAVSIVGELLEEGLLNYDE